MSKLSHVDDAGQARMVDVGAKGSTERLAVASARICTRPDIVAQVRHQAMGKGDVLAVARVAGIMAAKRTAELIPLCHPLALDSVTIDFDLEEDAISIRAKVTCAGKTGVEMEALGAVTIAALTIYDMCKALDRSMVISRVQLEEKNGGKSGHFVRQRGRP